LFEMDGVDERASGLLGKQYDCLNLFTNHSLQNVQDNILVLVDEFLVKNELARSK
jgi:hypothetical protein